MSKFKYLPTYPAIRSRRCPAGPPRHPVNRSERERCPLSQLMFNIGASEGAGGPVTTRWTQRTFTKSRLERYGFDVVITPGKVTRARCKKCDTEMSLRKVRR